MGGEEGRKRKKREMIEGKRKKAEERGEELRRKIEERQMKRLGGKKEEEWMG